MKGPFGAPFFTARASMRVQLLWCDMRKAMDPVNVLGIDYEVLYVDQDHEDMKDKTGLCDHDHCRLLLVEEYPDGAQRETLMHEIIHAVDVAMRAGLSEKQVLVLARGLLGVLRSNQHLTERIFRS